MDTQGEIFTLQGKLQQEKFGPRKRPLSNSTGIVIAPPISQEVFKTALSSYFKF